MKDFLAYTYNYSSDLILYHTIKQKQRTNHPPAKDQTNEPTNHTNKEQNWLFQTEIKTTNMKEQTLRTNQTNTSTNKYLDQKEQIGEIISACMNPSALFSLTMMFALRGLLLFSLCNAAKLISFGKWWKPPKYWTYTLALMFLWMTHCVCAFDNYILSTGEEPITFLNYGTG